MDRYVQSQASRHKLGSEEETVSPCDFVAQNTRSTLFKSVLKCFRNTAVNSNTFQCWFGLKTTALHFVFEQFCKGNISILAILRTSCDGK